MDEEKIAQGTYDFRVMRKKGYRYVDKTALLYPLVTRDGDGFFFISRPRRFGKSLMLSTLESANSSKALPSTRWTTTGNLTPSSTLTSARWM